MSISDGTPNWYYCTKHNHWWTDRPDLDRGMPTGYNRGIKSCEREKLGYKRGKLL